MKADTYMGSLMRRYKKLILPFVFFSLWQGAAQAEVPVLEPLNYELRYDGYVAGLPIGRLRVTMKEDALSYSMQVDTKSRGLVDIFAPIQSVASVQGRKQDERYLPIAYRSFAKKDDKAKNRKVRMDYDENGIITLRERIPKPDPSYSPVVPLDEIAGAPDPMTGVFAMRAALREAMAAGERKASLNTYDAARLATMRSKVVSRASIEVMDEHVRAINTVLSRKPIAGYTVKELKKYAEGDPTIHVYYSADERLLPLRVTIGLPFGTLNIVLTEMKQVAGK